MLAGVSGSGKTSCYQTLSTVYNSALHNHQCVSLSVITPSAYSVDEVSGVQHNDTIDVD